MKRYSSSIFLVLQCIFLTYVSSQQPPSPPPPPSGYLIIYNVIDGFVSPHSEILLSLTGGETNTTSDFFTTPSNNTNPQIIGGERDMEVKAFITVEYYEEYYSNWGIFPTFSSTIGEGSIQIISPDLYEIKLQYDGDDQSMNLNKNGLNGIDLTSNGKAIGIHFHFTSYDGSQVEIDVYSPDESNCKNIFPITHESESFYLLFTSFEGNCSFSSVGAIEIIFSSNSTFFGTFYMMGTYGISSLLSIDNFSIDTDLFILTPIGGISSPQSNQSFSLSPPNVDSILGQERDLELVITSSLGNSIYSSQIRYNQWSVEFEKQSKGYSVIQYDGVDGSMNLNISGLTSISPNGVDLTQSASANGIYLMANSFGYFNVFVIEIYSPNGKSCVVKENLFNFGPFVYHIPFGEFEGECDFSSVGAVQLILPSYSGYASVLQNFLTY